ncbi:c-type cytochrome [Olleya aquimaris]|uniref:Cytochrome c553 n=1 Tax=Olleya aquimaris TaxID=639310 RepID=A0A327RKX4_9FLAO|nr:cytochrome c [Olleya aquimaris]RAJ16805.1 cytochrome c553 [Olleya aquimaris]
MKINFLIAIVVLLFLSCNSLDKKEVSKELSASIDAGQTVYQNFCLNCHMANGEGIEKVYPPLANSDYLKNNLEASIRATKYGLKGKIIVNGKVYNNVMAPMGLSDQEVADVMNYISNSWNNKNNTLITPEQVSKIQPK